MTPARSVEESASEMPWEGCPMRVVASKGLHVRIHEVVSRIPRGRIATYGQVARLAGLPGQARLVGYALHALPAGTSVPWQRVVNAQGAISTRAGQTLQRRLLEREGIRFDSRGRISLASFRWRPRRPRALPGAELPSPESGFLSEIARERRPRRP